MTHHAYYVEGAQTQFEDIKESLKPFYARQYEKFGIDEARELVALAALKGFSPFRQQVYVVQHAPYSHQPEPI